MYTVSVKLPETRSVTAFAVYSDFVSLRTMCIRSRVVVAVTFHQVDAAPQTEARTDRNNKCLKYRDTALEKCHNDFLLKMKEPEVSPRHSQSVIVLYSPFCPA